MGSNRHEVGLAITHASLAPGLIESTAEILSRHSSRRLTIIVMLSRPSSRDTIATPAVAEQPGTPATLGSASRYVRLGSLGSGGMGVVELAYDVRLRREVALKRLRDVAASRADGLVEEAIAMARLSHPNVVAVFDVVREGSTVVLVMEHVPGVTLAQWLAQRRGVDAIVEKLVDAGRGLEAAHRADMLHLDFKPTNVLVGADGRARVTDFGLARDLADANRCGATGAWGSEILGTPSFMAPEQHRGGPLDSRADQYAFCVTLWLALSGAYPFPHGELTELAKAKSQGAPAWPRGVRAPGRIVAALRRGLAPDPAERFASMSALLDAMQTRGTTRNGALALAGVVVLGLGIPLGRRLVDGSSCAHSSRQLDGIWDEARKAELGRAFDVRGTDYERDTWLRTRTRLDAFAAEFVAEHTSAYEAGGIRGHEPVDVLDLRMLCLQRAKTRFSAVIDVLGEHDVDRLERADDLADGVPPLAHCDDIEALRANAPPSPSPEAAARNEALRARLARANALDRAGKYTQALAIVQEVDDGVRQAGDPSLEIEHLMHLGAVLEHLERTREAELSFARAYRLALPGRRWSEALRALLGVADALGNGQGKLGPAEAAVDVALGIARHPSISGLDRIEAQYLSGALALLRGDDDEAEATLETVREQGERALGPDHERLINFVNSLAVAQRKQRRFDEAVAGHRRAIALAEHHYGASHPRTAMLHGNLGNTLDESNRSDEAVDEFRQAIALLEASVGGYHRDAATARSNLATVLRRLGRIEEAELEHRAVLAVRQRVLPPTHPEIALSHANLARTLLDQGRFEEAEEQSRLALALQTATLGSDHVDVARTRRQLASALRMQKRLDEAQRELAVVVEVMSRVLGPNDVEVAYSRMNLANVFYDLERFDDAAAIYRGVHADLAARLDPDDVDLARIRLRLGQVEQQRGRHADGERLIRSALLRLERSPTSFKDEISHAYYGIGLSLAGRGLHAEAIEWFERAVPMRKGMAPYLLSEVAFAMAKSLRALGRRGRAKTFAEMALGAADAAGPAYAAERSEIAAWLGRR